MSIHLDLFGGFWLDRRWWGLMNNRGSKKRNQFVSLPAALAFCDDLVIRRLRNGYQVQSVPNIVWEKGRSEAKTLAKKDRGLHVTARTMSRVPKKEAPREIAVRDEDSTGRQLALL